MHRCVGKPSTSDVPILINPESIEIANKELVRLSSHQDFFRNNSAEPSSCRPRFQPEYDIYACGLVLLQLGLWMSLPALRDRCKSDDDFRQKAKGVNCDMLRNQMGEIYWQATRHCLHNSFNRKDKEAIRYGR